MVNVGIVSSSLSLPGARLQQSGGERHSPPRPTRRRTVVWIPCGSFHTEGRHTKTHMKCQAAAKSTARQQEGSGVVADRGLPASRGAGVAEGRLDKLRANEELQQWGAIPRRAAKGCMVKRPFLSTGGGGICYRRPAPCGWAARRAAPLWGTVPLATSRARYRAPPRATLTQSTREVGFHTSNAGRCEEGERRCGGQPVTDPALRTRRPFRPGALRRRLRPRPSAARRRSGRRRRTRRCCWPRRWRWRRSAGRR